MDQVATGIAFGHSKGIIHRDIKPANLMLCENAPEPCIKVLDYGLAKQQGTDQTLSTHIRGSLDYMAPEQHKGMADERSDVYAMGRVLREMLRKKYAKRISIPRPIRKLIDTAIHQNPARRFQSATDFQSALQDIKKRWNSGSIPEFALPDFTLPIVTTTLSVVAAVLIFWLFPAPPPTFDPTASMVSYFNVDGEARVILETEPPTAKLYAYPLHDFRPYRRDEIYLGVGGGSHWLQPADYLIVAVWPDGSWHEVLRRVPGANRKPTRQE